MKKTQALYKSLKVTCACGNTFETKSTYLRDVLNIEICSKCHPFYNKDKKIVNVAGRSDKFKNKFGDLSSL